MTRYELEAYLLFEYPGPLTAAAIQKIHKIVGLLVREVLPEGIPQFFDLPAPPIYAGKGRTMSDLVSDGELDKVIQVIFDLQKVWGSIEDQPTQ